MPYNIRDHYRETNEAIADFQGEVGTRILWWEFDKALTTVDDLYDEGSMTGQRRWHAPKRVPVYSVIRTERAERPGSEGFYDASTIHFSALLEQLRKAGLSDPYDAQRHLFDRVLWDGEIFEIRVYQIHGRLQMYETTVGIDATEVDPAEMVNDPDFTAYLT